MSEPKRPNDERLKHVNTFAIDGRVTVWMEDAIDYMDHLEAELAEALELLRRRRELRRDRSERTTGSGDRLIEDQLIYDEDAFLARQEAKHE